jgi:hypothetical protein
MRRTFSYFDSGSRAFSCLLGLAALALAAGVAIGVLRPGDIAGLMLETFGTAFLVLLAALIFATLFCWIRQSGLGHDGTRRRPWTEAALQASDGISTLALTFTLLGISLGIGTLAERALTPETVQLVVRDLTKHFSLAFMTTVVGLPVSAAFRALIRVTEARLVAEEPRRFVHHEGDLK